MSQDLRGQMRRKSIWKEFYKYRYIYLMFLPVLVYYIIFHYVPMGGLVIAFKDYKPKLGLWGSKFVGLKHFKAFLNGMFAKRLIRNTLLINICQICFQFPTPIILALMINELKDNFYKRTVQTIVYMPHFIALVVICGMITEFSATTGLFNDIRAFFGLPRTNLLARPELFRFMYISTDIWQHVGWGTIIYLATLSGADPALHEAAAIDGAGRLRRIWHVNVPTLLPVIVVQLIMRVGSIMSFGYEKIILLYSPVTYETADVISTYVYRRGLQKMEYSFGAAVGLFNSVVNLVILMCANRLSRKLSETSLW